MKCFRPFVFFLAALFLPALPILAGDAQQKPEFDFHQLFQQAWREGLSGEVEQSSAKFDRLIRDNPKEWFLYDSFTQILENHERFDKAKEIYQKALEALPRQGGQITHRLKLLEEKRAFSKAMEKAPSWERASVFGTAEFAVKTNLPQDYYASIGEEAARLLHEEKQILGDLLGPSRLHAFYLKLLIFGRYSEYEAFLRNAGAQMPADYSAYYNKNNDEIAIYFNGSADWRKVAYEISQYLICELYLKNPSRFLKEGLSQYLAYKLTKEDCRSQVLHNLDYINWLYDQGQLTDVMDFFDDWKNPKNQRQFTMKVWMLTAFFLDGGDPFFRAFYERYLDFELRTGANSQELIKRYFETRLSPEDAARFNNQWLAFVLNLNFDKI